MFKQLVGIVFFLFVTIFVNGQLVQKNNHSSNSFSKGLVDDGFQFDAGTAATISSDKSFLLQNYFSPSKHFYLNKKFSLVAGVGIINTQWNNIQLFNQDNSLSSTNLNFTSLYTYATGLYKLNQKTTLNTHLNYEYVLLNSSQSPNLLINNYKELSFGVNYHVTPKFSFNAQFTFSDKPYHPFNYYNSGIGSPFTGFLPGF